MRSVQENSYINSPSIHNGNTSENFISTAYELHITQIDNE